MKFTMNVSFPEARKKVEATQTQAKSYAATAATKSKPSMISHEVQTEIQWPIDIENFTIVPVPTMKEVSPKNVKSTRSSATATDIKNAPTQKATTTTAPKPKPHETMRQKIQINKPINANSANSVNSKQQQSAGKTPAQKQTGNQSKGNADPIRLQNQFSSLEDMDVVDPASESATDGGRRHLPLPKS